ncbi:efflux RND transporter periplasmic adaptor subunit [Undibacterium rugosum]|uniref:efflux RND transporter periplasmic adaptor subunit n=1 Tax=Undibacterium rugosum TaxID=2762291 RepID=UPI001B8102D1|nr:efflux RND transporter periplasmic adaptor subunit [Undibacterium rugosum]MBR7779540.1 efflux RND transporter periplasmic adaptor subunit [Undibacterium rugosum]
MTKLTLTCLLPLLGMPLASLASEPAQITLNSAQIQRANIATTALISSEASAKTTTGTPQGLHLSGTVISPPNGQVIVSSMVSGIVQEVQHNALQAVHQGQPIVVLHSPQLMEMQREYLQLATSARLAAEKRERDEKLLQEGIIARSRWQESSGAAVQAEVAARERYQSLRSAGLSDARISQLLNKQQLSPVLSISASASGTLSELSVKPGQRIEAGTPIAAISKSGPYWVELQASAQQAAQVRIGDSVSINQCAPLKVIAIANQVQSQNQTSLIRATQSKREDCLQLNQYVEARIQSSQIPAASVAVPLSAIVQNQQRSHVFIRNDKGFQVIPVQVLSKQGELAWLQASHPALRAGNQVANRGIGILKGAWLGLGAEEGGEK